MAGWVSPWRCGVATGNRGSKTHASIDWVKDWGGTATAGASHAVPKRTLTASMSRRFTSEVPCPAGALSAAGEEDAQPISASAGAGAGWMETSTALQLSLQQGDCGREATWRRARRGQKVHARHKIHRELAFAGAISRDGDRPA